MESFSLHVFPDRYGHPSASANLPDGKRTYATQLTPEELEVMTRVLKRARIAVPRPPITE